MMKLTIGDLKRLIAEALNPVPEKRAEQIVHATVDAAEAFVDSVVAGQPDQNAIEKLKQLTDQAMSLAKWMASHHERKAPFLTRFATLAQDVTKDTGFWSRPTFFGRNEYVEKLQTKVRKLQNAQVNVISN